MTSDANTNAANADQYTLPDLPYEKNALEAKGISQETIEYHYGKHHAGYVRKLNAAAADGLCKAGTSLEELIRTTENPKVFNLAAQIVNHTFYWNSMSPKGGEVDAASNIAKALTTKFGSVAEFQVAFKARAGSHFGSGWVWLSVDANGALVITDGHDAFNPIKDGLKPVLTIDVWEHAYYIDRKNNRGAYIDSFLTLINWPTVEERYNAACAAQ